MARVIAVVRDFGGDERRQRLLKYLPKDIELARLEAVMPAGARLKNMVLSARLSRREWKEASKKNTYYFRKMSEAISGTIDREYGDAWDVIFLFEGLYSPGLGDHVCKPYVVYEDTNAMICRRKWPQWTPAPMNTREYLRLENEYYQNAEYILTITESTRQSFIKDYGISGDRVRTIGVGSNLPMVERISDGAADTKNILFVGYEQERKGLRYLLEAFRAVRREEPNACLCIVGPHTEVHGDGICHLGRVRDRKRLQEIFQQSTVFVMPSLYDPFAIAVLEAMGCGLPVIVSDGCGISERITDGVDGFVVPARDGGAIAQRICELLKDPQECRRMGEAALRTVREHFCWDDVAERVGGIIASIVSERRDRSAVEIH